MFIKSMTIEDSDSAQDTLHIPDPIWTNVETAIRKMDGAARCTVTLDGPSGEFMGIGGGENNMYFCFVVDEFGQETRLFGSPNVPKATIRVFMGQWNIRDAREAVGLCGVIAVARNFFETGELAKDYKWRK